MGTTPRLLLAATVLILSAADAAAQCCWPRPPRPPRSVPHDLRPAMGVVLGPTSRAAALASDGFQLGISGDVPLPDGFVGRAELGIAAWNTDPATDGGATFLSIRHMTVSAYRTNGTGRTHTFIGGGFGLYRFRVRNADGSGTKPGVHGGVGIEGGGKRMAMSVEARLTFAGGGRRAPMEAYGPHDAVLHASLLLGVKRRF
jgi:hypothetical protein